MKKYLGFLKNKNKFFTLFLLMLVFLLSGVVAYIYKNNKPTNRVETPQEVAGTSSEEEPTPTPTKNAPTKQFTFSPTPTLKPTNTPTPEQDINIQVVLPITSTPYPTSTPAQSSNSNYDQEASISIKETFLEMAKNRNDCLAERDVLTQPLRDQISELNSRYSALDYIKDSALIADANDLLDEIQNLQGQIYILQGQYPCY